MTTEGLREAARGAMRILSVLPGLSEKSSRLRHQVLKSFIELIALRPYYPPSASYNAELRASSPLRRRRNALHRSLSPRPLRTHPHPPRRRHILSLARPSTQRCNPKSQCLAQCQTCTTQFSSTSTTPTASANRDASAESRQITSCEVKGESGAGEHLG